MGSCNNKRRGNRLYTESSLLFACQGLDKCLQSSIKLRQLWKHLWKLISYDWSSGGVFSSPDCIFRKEGDMTTKQMKLFLLSVSSACILGNGILQTINTEKSGSENTNSEPSIQAHYQIHPWVNQGWIWYFLFHFTLCPMHWGIFFIPWQGLPKSPDQSFWKKQNNWLEE